MVMYGFTVQNRKAELASFPKEDSFAYDEKRKIACVADGITRDFTDGSVVTRNLRGLIKVLTGKYPKYAQKASQFCVENFLETKSLEESNKAIGNYNSDTFREVDYIAHDLAGCTAAGFWEEDGFLNWQFICDSGIAILDNNGNLKFRTPDEGPHFKEKLLHLEQVLSQHGGFNNPEGRRIIRSQYRNNPEKGFAYGALTGEENALPYIKKGKEKLNDGDYVLAFTDGIGDLLFTKDEEDMEIKKEYGYKVITKDFSSLIRLCKKNVSTEGTLIVYGEPRPFPPRGAWGRDMDYEAHING